MQVVEPGADLARVLYDKISREVRAEMLGILKRIVELPVRHRARLKPAVKHLRHSLHLLSALARNLYRVEELLVDVGQRCLPFPLDLLDRREHLSLPTA